MMSELLRFVSGPLPGPALPAQYDLGLVVLSYVVASLAAYTAIDLAGRVSEYRLEPRRAAGWLAGGAFAMGAGIWSMHARAAHAFKSGNANLGAAALAELCRRLERHCREGATAGAEPLITAIEEEFAYVAADLAGRVRETAG